MRGKTSHQQGGRFESTITGRPQWDSNPRPLDPKSNALIHCAMRSTWVMCAIFSNKSYLLSLKTKTYLLHCSSTFRLKPMADSTSRRQGHKRLLVTISILLAFISGIPVWWWTTEIHRSPIPFAVIKEHSENVSSQPLLLPCHLHVIFIVKGGSAAAAQLEAWAASVREDILASLHSAVDTCGSGFKLLVSVDSHLGCRRTGEHEGFVVWPCGLAGAPMDRAFRTATDHELDELLWKYSVLDPSNPGGPDQGGKYSIIVRSDVEDSDTGGNNLPRSAAVVGKHRHAWISVAKDFDVVPLIREIAHVYFDHRRNAHVAVEEHGQVVSMPLGADGKVVLSFSLLNAEPKDWIYDWDFKTLEMQFLKPIVKAMSPVGMMSIESQVLHYTRKGVQAAWDTNLGSYALTPDKLPFFVNSREWPLDSSTASVGRSKLLHFVIYIPASDESPLRIKHASGQSLINGFTSPGWGGVTIWNPPTCETGRQGSKPAPRRLDVEDMQGLMGIIVAQLRALFGLPSLEFNNTSGLDHVPAVTTGIADWEIDVLLRRRIAADELAAAATLTSLSELVQSLPNMVIEDEIAEQVSMSLEAANAARSQASRGAYFATGDAVRRARALAEDAFFQPSFMSLQYFPLEHHLAIYTPFFVPVLSHVLVAVLKEIFRRYRRGKLKAD